MAKLGRAFRAATVGLPAVGLMLSGCGLLGDDGPERDEDGAITAAGEVEAFDLAVGDCYDSPDAAEIAAVMVVPCDEPHDFEVYHFFHLPDGDFPGKEQMEEEWISGCLDEFDAFVGNSFDESELDISALFPTRENWEELNDREVLCSVTAVDGQPRTGSARGSGA